MAGDWPVLFVSSITSRQKTQKDVFFRLANWSIQSTLRLEVICVTTTTTMPWGSVGWLFFEGERIFLGGGILKIALRGRFKKKYLVTSWGHNWVMNQKITPKSSPPKSYHLHCLIRVPIHDPCSTILPLPPFTLKPTISSMKSCSSLAALAIFIAEAWNALPWGRFLMGNSKIPSLFLWTLKGHTFFVPGNFRSFDRILKGGVVIPLIFPSVP